MKITLLGLLLSSFLAAAEAPDLLAQMTTLQKSFTAHKTAERAAVIADLPQALKLIGLAMDDVKLAKATRIKAIVNLAAATVPFDETIPAGDVISEDYVKPGNAPLYDAQLALVKDESVRNRLVLSIKKNADTFLEMKREHAHP